MTVAEFIALLQQFPPDLQVIHEYDGLYTEAEATLVTDKDPEAPYGPVDWNGEPTPTPPFILVS